MGDLTKNLSRHEMACKCGCGSDSMDFETVMVVQDVCDEFKCSVTVTSAHRCFKYNRSKAVGSNDNSQHPQARGMDCKFGKVTPEGVHAYLCKKYPDKYGFGVYNSFNHIDTRTNGPARWDVR